MVKFVTTSLVPRPAVVPKDLPEVLDRIRGFFLVSGLGIAANDPATRDACQALAIDAQHLLLALSASLRQAEPVVVIPEEGTRFDSPEASFLRHRHLAQLAEVFEAVEHVLAEMDDGAMRTAFNELIGAERALREGAPFRA